MKDLETKAVELLDKLEAITTEYTPEVTEAALTAVQVSGYHSLLTGVLALLALIATFYGYRHLNKIIENKKEQKDFYDPEIPKMLLVIWAGGFASLAAIAAIDKLTDVWTWAAIFQPELYLVHKLTGL